jgi:G6PDH family F420-dependent oxidoreductase
MLRYGFTLYCENHDPRDVVQNAVAAEAAGFDYLVVIDHFHPWLLSSEPTAFAWSMLGAVAQATHRIKLVALLTCPIMRYHPSIVAQGIVTLNHLLNSRFTLGLRMDEHAAKRLGVRGWPSEKVSLRQFGDALEIIHKLWAGSAISYNGGYYLELDDASVLNKPKEQPKLFIAVEGKKAAKLAVERAGGICNSQPVVSVYQPYISQGGDKNSLWGQIVTSYASTKSEGLEIAYKSVHVAGGKWKAQGESTAQVNVETAIRQTPESFGELLSAGPNPEEHARSIRAFLDAGVTSMAVAYPGPNLGSYLKFWKNELRPLLP